MFVQGVLNIAVPKRNVSYGSIYTYDDIDIGRWKS